MSNQIDIGDAPDEADPDQKVTITLRTPITLGSQTHTEMTFRPVTGKDMRLMPVDEKRPVAGVMWMMGRLSGQTQAVTDKLIGSDLKAAIDVVNGFLEGTPDTGDESSGT